MDPTTLLLVRHGHVRDNDGGAGARMSGWADPPLTALGWTQVARLRARLPAEPPAAAIYTSPLRRARDTAQAVADTLRVRPRVCDALREISCGDLEGWRLSDVQRCFPDLWQRNLAQTDETFRWPGGESYGEFRARCLRAVRRIAAAHPGRRVLVVTHAGVITQVLGALHGTSPARWKAFRPGNASITEVRWQATGGSLVRFDACDHLHGLDRTLTTAPRSSDVSP